MKKNRIEKIDSYAPLGFVRGHDNEAWRAIFTAELVSDAIECFEFGDAIIYYKILKWDSEFFKNNFFKIEFIDGNSTSSMSDCISRFLEYLSVTFQKFYVFSEVPCEDVSALGALNQSQFKIVETRICWYRDDVQEYEYKSRSSVRHAQAEDIANLRRAASSAVNIYDKYHADDFFEIDQASSYLETFIENSVNGFADVVLVPESGAANAFLTGDYLGPQEVLGGRRLGKMVLSAVMPERSGWYTRLISEMSYLFKAQSIDVTCMTTQATNRAVIKVWQRLGYLYGRSTHVVSHYRK